MINLDELRALDMPGIDGENVTIHEPIKLVKVDSNYDSLQEDIRKDYALVRENLHYQSQMLLDASKIFIESTKNADNPRFIDSFSTLMNQMTNTNKEILKIHKEIKALKEETPKDGPKELTQNNTTNVYMSTSDMLDQMGGSQDIIEGEFE